MHELRVLSVNFGLASPASLSQSCLEFISDNLEAICEEEKFEIDPKAETLPFSVHDVSHETFFFHLDIGSRNGNFFYSWTFHTRATSSWTFRPRS